MNILFFPIFSNSEDLNDHYYRMAWYLSPVSSYLSNVTMLVDSGSLKVGPVPRYLDPHLDSLADKLQTTDIIAPTSDAAIEHAIEKADAIFLWQGDETKTNSLPETKFSARLASKKL